MTDDQKKKYEEAAKEHTRTHFSFHSSLSAMQGESFFMGATHAHNELSEKIDALANFKKYVHDRLDKMGIPSDPEPENNNKHGCRIEGRLNFMENRLKQAHNAAIDAAIQQLNSERQNSYIISTFESFSIERLQKLKL